MIDDALRSLICDTADAHPHMGAVELATLVAAATPDNRVRDYYAGLLSGAVRTVVNQHRRQPTPPSPEQPKPKPEPTPLPSPKLEQRRSWWQDTLAGEVHVGGEIRKRIGECTVDDLEFCIKERDVAIERIEGQIGNFRRLQSLMRKHDARVVADLPEQTSWGRA